ncbi:DUF3971 domain-containing protein, partial [Rosenbergiella nectarea]|uniref:YhdP family protein n=2 Tax=Rosenbergiella TaxID=1356488 RepID=UPI001F4FB394
GKFTYNNGRLVSTPISAQWFGQPVNVVFSTQENAKQFDVNIQADGNWSVERVNAIPKALSQQLQGELPWQSQITIALPHDGGANYH